MIPNSRQSLINYCLRNLGAPVLEINVDGSNDYEWNEKTQSWIQTES